MYGLQFQKTGLSTSVLPKKKLICYFIQQIRFARTRETKTLSCVFKEVVCRALRKEHKGKRKKQKNRLRQFLHNSERSWKRRLPFGNLILGSVLRRRNFTDSFPNTLLIHVEICCRPFFISPNNNTLVCFSFSSIWWIYSKAFFSYFVYEFPSYCTRNTWDQWMLEEI